MYNECLLTIGSCDKLSLKLYTYLTTISSKNILDPPPVISGQAIILLAMIHFEIASW